MTLLETQKLSKHLCRLLKVTDITFPIGRTSKGNFGIVFNENGEWEMMLDSIPLSTKNVLTDENNIELKAMVEKYLFEKDDWNVSPPSPKTVIGIDLATGKSESWEEDESGLRKVEPVSPAKEKTHGNSKATKSI